MRKLLARLWADDRGSVMSADYILTSVAVLGTAGIVWSEYRRGVTAAARSTGDLIAATVDAERARTEAALAPPARTFDRADRPPTTPVTLTAVHLDPAP